MANCSLLRTSANDASSDHVGCGVGAVTLSCCVVRLVDCGSGLFPFALASLPLCCLLIPDGKTQHGKGLSVTPAEPPLAARV
eukprot:scaffold501_cov105-Isochrysis_galbana.AAC.10